MGWVKIRVPRTSQPQDACGIDWSNPITAGLAVVRTGKELYGSIEGAITVGTIGLQVGGNTVRYPLGEVPTEGITLFQLARFESVNGISSLNICTGTADGIGFKNNTTSIRLLNYIGGGNNTITISSKTLPINTTVAVCGTYDGATQRIYQEGEQTGSTSKTGALVLGASPTLNLGANFAVGSFTGGACPLLLYYTRALPAAEVKSLTDNPWQIFEPEELTIWVPDAVGSGGTDHLLTPASSQQPNTASACAITQTHLIGASSSTQGNVGTAGSVSQGSITQVTAANSTQPNTASAGSIAQTHQVGAASSGTGHTGTAAAVSQTHLISAASSQQANTATAGSVSQSGAQTVSAANSVQANTASAGGISQTHLIVCAPVAVDNVASASSIVQTHLIGAASSVQGNQCSAGSASHPAEDSPSIYIATSPAQSYTATSPAQSYTAVVPAQIYST